jgi:hypothetical protein
MNHLAVHQLFRGFKVRNFQGAHRLDGQSHRPIGTGRRGRLSQALSRGPQDAENLCPIESLTFTVITEAHVVIPRLPTILFRCATVGNGMAWVMGALALLVILLPGAAAADDQTGAAQGSAAVAADGSSSTRSSSTRSSTQSSDAEPESQNKRIFGIIPNHRTTEEKEHRALTRKEKFSLAAEDTFDWGTYLLAAGFAGYGQVRNATPAFGHGVPGYARYLAAAYGDQAIGNMMTEAIFPVILHQDPRYFRRGTGSGWSRLGYAAGQIFAIHSDSGATRFNLSEIAGNLTAVGIATTYYPDNRNVPDVAAKFGIQIGTDMTSNILKEFWPDLSEAFSNMFHRKTP